MESGIEIAVTADYHCSRSPSSFNREYVLRYTISPRPLKPNGGMESLYFSRKGLESLNSLVGVIGLP